MNDTPPSPSARWASMLYWVAGLVFVVCLVSAIMSVSLFEGAERYQGAWRWLAGAVIALIVNRLAKRWAE